MNVSEPSGCHDFVSTIILFYIISPIIFVISRYTAPRNDFVPFKRHELVAITGLAKLTDFGMSKLNEISNGQFTLAPNLPPGSPCYVAPEVIQCKQYERNSKRSIC